MDDKTNINSSDFIEPQEFKNGGKRNTHNVSNESDSKVKLIPGIDLIGRIYDVTGGYATPESVLSPIIDEHKLPYPKNKFLIDEKEFDIYEFITATAIISNEYTEFLGVDVDDYQSKTKIDLGLGAKYKGFSASISTGFEKSKIEKTNCSIYTTNYEVKKYKLSLNKTKKDEFRRYLLPKFKDLLENGDPYELFYTYGTHFLTEVIMGARVTVSVYFNKYINCISSETTFDPSLVFSQLAKGSNELKVKEGKNIELTSSQKNVISIGGELKISSIDLLNKDTFKKWCESISINNCSFIAFPPTSQKSPLIGVWELLDESNKSRIQQLRLSAEQYILNKQQEIARGDVNYLIIIRTADQFLAGTGSDVKIKIKGKLKGQKVETDFINLSNEGEFTRGSEKKIIKTKIPDLGDIYKVIVKNDNDNKNQIAANWLLSEIVIIPEGEIHSDNQYKEHFQFVYNKWIATGEEAKIPLI